MSWGWGRERRSLSSGLVRRRDVGSRMKGERESELAVAEQLLQNVVA